MPAVTFDFTGCSIGAALPPADGFSAPEIYTGVTWYPDACYVTDAFSIDLTTAALDPAEGIVISIDFTSTVATSPDSNPTQIWVVDGGIASGTAGNTGLLIELSSVFGGQVSAIIVPFINGVPDYGSGAISDGWAIPDPSEVLTFKATTTDGSGFSYGVFNSSDEQLDGPHSLGGFSGLLDNVTHLIAANQSDPRAAEDDRMGVFSGSWSPLAIAPPEPGVEGIGLRVSSGDKNVTFGFGVTGGGIGSAEKSFDWLGCEVPPMVAWQDYDPPEIVTNDNMPTDQECSVLGVGQAPLGFTIEGLGDKGGQIGALLSVKVPFPPVGSGEENQTLWVGLVTDDGQNGSVMAINTNNSLSPYNLVNGVLTWAGVFGSNPEPYGTDSWSLLEFQIRWDFTSTVTVRVDVVNANDETNTVMNARVIGDVTAGVNTLLMSPDDLGAGSNTLGMSTAYVQADIAELDVAIGNGAVVSTHPLRIAFPHDIIFTSGPDALPYSGYFWPPSTPIPPSQIYIPRGPDPITGEPNFKRMQWTVTTADTPREIQMGDTPGFSYGDPDVPGSPPSNC